MRRLCLFFVALMLPLTAHAESIVPNIFIRDGWSVPPVAGLNIGVAYVSMVNQYAEPVTLTHITGDVSETIELHTHLLVKDIMQMRQLNELVIEPNQDVTFKPGGLHLMLINLKKPLDVGDSFPVTFHFKDREPVTTTITVRSRDNTEKNPHAEHHH